MHVILLGRIGEIVNTLHQWIVRPGHVDRVIDNIARMGNPLATNDELILNAFAKSITGSAMISGYANAVLNRRRKVLGFLLLDL